MAPVTAADVAGFAAARGAEGPSRPGAGPTATGPRADGLPYRRCRIVHPDGSVGECRCVRDLLRGDRVPIDPSGAVAACGTWRHGRAVEPGTGGCEGTEGSDR